MPEESTAVMLDELEFGGVKVPAALTKAHEWLKKLRDNRKTEDMAALRLQYEEREVRDSADKLARKYHLFTTAMEVLKARRAAVANDLVAMFFRDGMTKAEGITISPTAEGEIDADALLRRLTPSQIAQVVETVPAFAVTAFLALADKDPELQERFAHAFSLKVEVEVKRVVELRKEGAADAEALASKTGKAKRAKRRAK